MRIGLPSCGRSRRREVGYDIPQIKDFASEEATGGSTAVGGTSGLALLSMEDCQAAVLNSIRNAAVGRGLSVEDEDPFDGGRHRFSHRS